jgi:hypothetical protein
MVEYDTPMKGQTYIQEVKMQIQRDIISYMGNYDEWARTGLPTGYWMQTDLNRIVVDNFKKLED